jgi:2-polyprenyl-3-methyl-5-hydroxy-6-metoxy-1,4-benzoquinol methylase
MKNPSLIVISTSSRPAQKSKVTKSGINQRMREQRALFDRKWLQDPMQFACSSIIEKKRILRTKQVIKKHFLKEKNVIDIGCGFGDLSLFCKSLKHPVTACELSTNALKHLDILKKSNISICIQQLPFTSFDDKSCDNLLCADTIGDLPPREYRLTFSELSRILSLDGILVCSTGLDHKAYLPHRTFIKLAATEFHLIDALYSYHYLYERIQYILSLPKKILGGQSITKPKWKKIFLSPPFAFFWKIIDLIFSPISFCLEKNKNSVTILEMLTKILFNERGITHIIYIGKRKRLF